MSEVLSDDVQRFLRLATADPGPVLREMEEHGRDRGFPIVGPEVGRVLRLLAQLVDASRVFEFGSGFGYSAAWFAGVVPPDGELVLTDFEEANLDEAREFLGRLDDAPTVHYEAGDAMETFERYEGPFDVVLVDHEKTQYVPAFERARGRLADGGVVVADNMMSGPVEFDDVLAGLDGADPSDESTAAIVSYIRHVRDDPEFETAFLPLGEGIAVSVRR